MEGRLSCFGSFLFFRALTLTVLRRVVAMAGCSAAAANGLVGSFVAERRRFWFFKVVRKLLSR